MADRQAKVFHVFDLTRAASWQTPIRVSAGNRPDAAWFRQHMCVAPPDDVHDERVVVVQLFSDAEGTHQHRKCIHEWIKSKTAFEDAPLYVLIIRQKALNIVYMGCVFISILRGTEMGPNMFLTLETHPVRGCVQSCTLSGMSSIDTACVQAWVRAHVLCESPHEDAEEQEEESSGKLSTLWEALDKVRVEPTTATTSWIAASMIVKGATFESKKMAMKKWILWNVHTFHGRMVPRRIELGVPVTLRIDKDVCTPLAWSAMVTTWSFPYVTLVPHCAEHVDALERVEWMRLWKGSLLSWRSSLASWCEMIQALPGEIMTLYRQTLHHIVHPWVTEKVMRNVDVKGHAWLDAAAMWTMGECSANPSWNVALETCRLASAPIRSGSTDPTAGISLERIVEELNVTEEEAHSAWHALMELAPEFLRPWVDAVLVRGELKNDARHVWSTLIVFVSHRRADREIDPDTSPEEYLQFMFASWMIYVGAHAPENTLNKDRISKMADLVKSKLRRLIQSETHLTPGMSAVKEHCESPASFWRDIFAWSGL